MMLPSSPWTVSVLWGSAGDDGAATEHVAVPLVNWNWTPS